MSGRLGTPLPPAYYLQHRAVGTEAWSAPLEFYSFPSVRDAMERARGLHLIGGDGIVTGHLHEWRLVRSGVCVHAWREDGRP